MKYRKKPITVEAFQICGDTHFYIIKDDELSLHKFFPAFLRTAWNKGKLYVRKQKQFEKDLILITLDGECKIHPGDWILKGEKENDLYPCKPDIFQKIYEKETEETDYMKGYRKAIDRYGYKVALEKEGKS